MKKILYLISFAALVLSSACKKIEGPGGTSAIRGQVIGSTSEAGESEITQVICTAGIELEHGDYWLLNTSDPNKLYYVYYDNSDNKQHWQRRKTEDKDNENDHDTNYDGQCDTNTKKQE